MRFRFFINRVFTVDKGESMDFIFYGEFSTTVRQKGIEETARFAKEKGFSGVEFLESSAQGTTFTLQDIPSAKKTAEILRAHGLDVACYSVECCLWADEVENLKKHAELASALGSPFLHHTLIPWLALDENSPSYEQAFEKIIERATEVANYAKSLGLICLYEEQGMYFNGKGFDDFYLEIKRRCDNVGVCGDFGNDLFVDENPVDFIEKYKTEIKHAHLKDYQFLPRSDQSEKGAEWYKTKGGNYLKDCPLGAGVVEFDKAFHALQTSGYQGKYALEISLSMVDSGMAFAKRYAK